MDSIDKFRSYANHIEMVCQRPLFEASAEYPIWKKVIDLTLGTILVGVVEVAVNSLLAVAHLVGAVGSFVLAMIFLLGRSFDTAGMFAKYFGQLSISTASFTNQAIRGCLKMVPVLSPPLIKLYDTTQAGLVALFQPSIQETENES